ncbi:hypothetical protein NQ317_003400 [Molorchus minor]|uniref:Serine/threonine-protein phosphatase 4 regulatory subunit 2 n=1 Tax=Molorchus minor TaxID=1323400 RepID=A0ABQ9K999_9CUCU|nr:hypothetical protein NQ317_003400 [Molorchus minor]
MENPEEILHSLEEFSKMKPKDIPRELEEYLCFVAKTGNPVYQWPVVKSLFREKLINVITEFYESCPSVNIPPCPNVEMFNYDLMKNFILEKLDTFAAAPFTVQRICELLTTPRKEYNRIDKYMRALEKNILVVSTTEPGRRSENGEGIMNGIESEHMPESSNSSHEINVEEMDDDSPARAWPRAIQVAPVLFESSGSEAQVAIDVQQIPTQESFENGAETKLEVPSSSTAIIIQPQIHNQETVITCRSIDETPYVSIEPVPLNTCLASHQEIEENQADSSSVTITAVPAVVHRRRTSVESSDCSEREAIEAEQAKIEEYKEPLETELDVETTKEEITSTVFNPEPTEELNPETTVEDTAATSQEESGVDNILSGNKSPCPDESKADVDTEENNEQDQLETTAPVVEEPEEKDIENVEEEKEPLIQQEVSIEELKEQDLDGIPLEHVPDIENVDNENLTDKIIVEEPVEIVPVVTSCEEAKEAESSTEPTMSDVEQKIESEGSLMEVDVVNEPAQSKTDDSLSDEPSSTSDAPAL